MSVCGTFSRSHNSRKLTLDWKLPLRASSCTGHWHQNRMRRARSLKSFSCNSKVYRSMRSMRSSELVSHPDLKTAAASVLRVREAIVCVCYDQKPVVYQIRYHAVGEKSLCLLYVLRLTASHTDIANQKLASMTGIATVMNGISHTEHMLSSRFS